MVEKSVLLPLVCTVIASLAEIESSDAGEVNSYSPSGAIAPAWMDTKPVVEPNSPVYGYRIVNSYPHDVNAFTQGLIFHDGFLYESTGMRGHSSLRKVELETGNILQKYLLPARFFGEGLTRWRNKLIQLTWRRGMGIVYDQKTFHPLYSFPYSTEGWGITHNGQYLIMSDGSSILYFLDPETFQEVKNIKVHDGNDAVANLNELEYVNGEIYANVWLTDYIARIAPETGQVLGWIDLKGLLEEEERTPSVDVLNGIAYDEQQDRLFVTGKYWPKLFEIELMKKSH
jgi:glutaminyl-peptide cyclotransferase